MIVVKYLIISLIVSIIVFFSTIHMFEPVPSFFEELTGHWNGYKAELGFDASLYNFGLGSKDR